MFEYISTVCAVTGVAIEIVWYVNCEFCWLSSSRGFQHYDIIGLTSMIETGLIFHTYCVRYPFANPFKFALIFSCSKNVKSTCCLGGIHLQITLNLLKYGLFCSYRMHAIPSPSKICPERSKTLCNFFQWIFLNEHYW